MKLIVLADWTEFEVALLRELNSISHAGKVIARNFALTSVTEDHVETDRLALMNETGTDRDETSTFWNEPGFDHDHTHVPRDKRPDEIVYAFTIEPTKTSYLVHHDDAPSSLDITEGLSQYDGIVIYEPSGLIRVSKNEYWFNCNPLDVALLVFKLADVD